MPYNNNTWLSIHNKCCAVSCFSTTLQVIFLVLFFFNATIAAVVSEPEASGKSSILNPAGCGLSCGWYITNVLKTSFSKRVRDQCKWAWQSREISIYLTIDGSKFNYQTILLWKRNHLMLRMTFSAICALVTNRKGGIHYLDVTP